MSDREFNGLFTFALGFEGSALKVPEEEDPGKKQIIGFAKFKTRPEALEAVAVLAGRKLDLERGCVLKAEMAKKNLHTKRMEVKMGNNPIYRRSRLDLMQYVDPALFSAEDPFDYYKDPLCLESRDANSDFYKESVDGSLYPPPFAVSAEESSSAAFEASPRAFTPTTSLPVPINNNGTPPDQMRTAFSMESSCDLFGRSPSSFNQGNLLNSSERGFNSALFSSDSLMRSTTTTSFANTASSFRPTQMPNRSVHLSPTASSTVPSGLGISSSWSGPSTNMTGIPLSLPFTGNDQNPPCNTLYVGNLPPDSDEEELRVLFSSAPGYKRMSFRNRGNGPMCFVEFESVYFATQSLVQLYGHHLSNSTKGGIRLSYSKNPLGVRQQPVYQPNYGFSSASPPNPDLEQMQRHS